VESINYLLFPASLAWFRLAHCTYPQSNRFSSKPDLRLPSLRARELPIPQFACDTASKFRSAAVPATIPERCKHPVKKVQASRRRRLVVLLPTGNEWTKVRISEKEHKAQCRTKRNKVGCVACRMCKVTTASCTSPPAGRSIFVGPPSSPLVVSPLSDRQSSLDIFDLRAPRH